MKTLGKAWNNRNTIESTKNYRKTSYSTWESIKDNKLMKGSHAELLKCLIDHFPKTVAEITPIYNEEYNYEFSRNEVAKRMSNLMHNYKVVSESSSRLCAVNGKPSIEYVPNNQLPRSLPKNKMTKNEKISMLESFIKEKGLLDEFNLRKPLKSAQ